MDATEVARAADTALATNPNLTPERATQLRREKAGAVETIESIANQDPKDAETQLDVSRSLASVEEAPRAIPYAERGLKLAETAGDKKMIREALLAGSEIYYKAGNYELARDRAQRILKANPRDPDAMALYMQVKDRGTGPAPASAGSGRSSALSTAGASAGSATGSAGDKTPTPRAAGVAMTNAGSLEASKQIANGWSRMKLDPAEALKHFDAAVAADPKSAAARVERSKARLEARDAAGALADSEAAIALKPDLGAAHAARGEARRALGRAEAEVLADYETAAKLDGGFTQAYKTALVRSGVAAGANAAGGQGAAGSAATDGPLGLLKRSPKGWGWLALIAAILAATGGVIAPLFLKRRRSDRDGSLPR